MRRIRATLAIAFTISALNCVPAAAHGTHHMHRTLHPVTLQWTGPWAVHHHTAAETRLERTTARASRTSSVRAWPNGNVVAILKAAAWRYRIDGDKMVRVARCESTLRPHAVSRTGKFLGLMQQHKGYWPERALAAKQAGKSALDPWANAIVSAWMVRYGGGWRHWPHCGRL